MVAADPSDEAMVMEKLYEFGKRLDESKDKLQNVEEYEGIISAAKTGMKTKQLAAHLIPRFFKFFPGLSSRAIDTHLDLIKEEELGVRVQAIRGLPLFCKGTPEHISKIIDILVQLLSADEFVERDAGHKALMALLRLDLKASLTALLKNIGSVEEPSQDDVICEKVFSFIRDKVFPIKAEVLKPWEEMDRHITHLIKKSLEDVNGAEFRMFLDFLNGLSIFGEKAPEECRVELSRSIEGQADLDAQFDLPNEQRLDQLKALAEVAPFTKPQDLCQIVPLVVQLLKKTMPHRKSGEEFNFTYVECLLYTFRYLADKVFGFPITSGEDFTEQNDKFTERLYYVEELTRASMKKLTSGMAEKNKVMASAKSDEAKDCSASRKGLHGTCIITAVGRGGMFTVADGRLVSDTELVIGGNIVKLVILNKRLLITVAGIKDHCDVVLNDLRARVEGKYNIRIVKNILIRYLKRRKEMYPDEVLCAGVNIFGYHNGWPMVYMSGVLEFVKFEFGDNVVTGGDLFQKLKYGDVVVSGTGGWFASNYFSHKTLTGETREEYFECLEQALAFAAFHDHNSGGHVRAADMSNGKDVRIELRKHVSQILRMNFNRLSAFMAPGFLVVSWGLSYSFENEARVRAILTERFRRPYSLNVFTVETPYNIITRVMFLIDTPAGSDTPAASDTPADLDILVENNRNLHHSFEFTLECFWPSATDFPGYMFMDDL